MRFVSILTSATILLLLQQLVSLWFLSDFFLARDSTTVDILWRQRGTQGSLYKNISLLSETVIGKHCGYDDSKESYFEKIVLVVVDALGSNFIPSIQNDQSETSKPPKRMPFLEDLIIEHKAMGFVAKAATPTVTMPRIKALLSGTIPSFIDIAYNLASDVRHFSDDNLIQIAKSKNKSIVFYGDDTWLSLFKRTIFQRSKETFSFFASDYTTVDTNVTEHALPETSKETIDWDLLILHYLGLDHLGHVFGTNNAPLIDRKLLEMDNIIQEIHVNLAKKNHKTLMVICGDHGMSKEGNHGGGSDLESNTAMVFLPINQELTPDLSVFAHRQPIRQIDFSVTISLLTGLDIPSMSRGVAIKPLLDSLWANDTKKVTCAIMNNVIQLSKLAGSENPELADRLTRLLIKHIEAKKNSGQFAQDYCDIAHQIQSELVQVIASRNYPILTGTCVLLVIALSLMRLRKTSVSLLLPVTNRMERIICLTSFFIPIFMQGSTDFIEYEHIFWPIFSMLILLMLVLLVKRSSLPKVNDTVRVISFVVTLVLTTLFQDLHLFRDSIVVPAISLIILTDFLRKTSSLPRTLSLVSSILVVVTIVACKYTEEQAQFNDSLTKTIDRAVVQRVALLIATLYTMINVARSKDEIKETDFSALIQRLASGWIITAILLARPNNILFIVANVLMEVSLNTILNKLEVGAVSRTLVYLNFAQSAFYNQGNTNLFSSIDVKPAFFGQTTYNIGLSVPLVAMSTFSAQIHWLLKLFQRVQGANEGVRDLINVRNFMSIGYFMFVCMILRNHLFVWSVLSPKLIYHYVSNLVILITTLLISILQRLQPCSKSTRTAKVMIA